MMYLRFYPEKLSDHVCAANHRQYHQAAETPLGRDPVLSTFGYKADTVASDELVTQGKLPEESLKDQLPETLTLLQTLANIDLSTSSELNIDITKNNSRPYTQNS